jgi:hypothetical protein
MLKPVRTNVAEESVPESGVLPIRAAPVFWLYGVTPRGQSMPKTFPVPLIAVHYHSLSAIVERLPRGGIRHAAAAGRHPMVLAALMREGLVIPAPAGTVLPSLLAVKEGIAAHAEQYARLIPRISGCDEWGLDLYCEQRRLLARILPGVPGGVSEDARINPEDAYAVEKQRQARAVARATRRIDQAVDEVFDELSLHTTEMIELSTPAGRDPQRGTLEKSLAVLVPRGSAEAFARAVHGLHERLAPDGFSLEASAHLTAYEFCRADDASCCRRGGGPENLRDDDPWYRRPSAA